MNPKRLPKVSVPKKSPIRLPNAAYSGGVTATYTIIRVFFQTAGRSRITRLPSSLFADRNLTAAAGAVTASTSPPIRR